MNWRFTSLYLAVQTALTAVSPLALGQEPHPRQAVATPTPFNLLSQNWFQQLDEIIAREVELSDAETGLPIKLSDAFGSNPSFPAKALIRPVHDRYLPRAFDYVLESQGNHRFQINVHKKSETGFFTATPLDLNPPAKDDSVETPSEWFLNRLRDKFPFFRQLRKFAVLDGNAEKIKTLPSYKSEDLALYSGIFVVSIIAIATAMAFEITAESRLARLGLWLAMIVGAGYMTYSGTILGLNHKELARDSGLKKIEEVFRPRFAEAPHSQFQQVLEGQLDDLLVFSQRRLSTPPVSTPAQAFDCGMLVMGILTPMLLIFNSSLPKVGIQNPLLRCALVLGIGVVSFMLGSVINSKNVEGLDPLNLPRSIELETELLFPALK